MQSAFVDHGKFVEVLLKLGLLKLFFYFTIPGEGTCRNQHSNRQ